MWLQNAKALCLYHNVNHSYHPVYSAHVYKVCKCTAEHFVQIQVDNPGPNTLKIYIGNHPLSSVSFIFYLNFGLHSIIMLLCWASSCIP